MEARRQGRLQEFLAALTAEVDAADQLLVTEDDWLDREAFRSDVEPILRRRPATFSSISRPQCQ